MNRQVLFAIPLALIGFAAPASTLGNAFELTATPTFPNGLSANATLELDPPLINWAAPQYFNARCKRISRSGPGNGTGYGGSV